MKNLMCMLLILCAALSCCVEEQQTGVANPAAVYCQEQGYEYRIVTEDAGQRGECRVNGTWIDEWEFYDLRNKGHETYEIVEETSVECSEDLECETPAEYLLRSDCPYTSKCIDNICFIVCPSTAPIGGDKDEHGCLIAAGYSWCASEEKCMRKWEEECPGDEEIDSFEDCVAAGYPVMESYPRQCSVSGTGKTYSEGVDILTPEECIQSGGRTVNIVGGATCNEDETYTGEVHGFISPNICCVPKETDNNTFKEECVKAGGHWNECGNRCQIDNQGGESDACLAMCEQLCECGGIAGFGCPEGYSCKAPDGIADALGYCEPKEEPFCGWSTNASCQTDTDCIPGGCSGQVCQSASEEPVITDCMYRECHHPGNYGLGCKCVDEKCQWA